MAASILKIGISCNPICDNLVGFPKSGHIYADLNDVCNYDKRFDACNALMARCTLITVPLVTHC